MVNNLVSGGNDLASGVNDLVSGRNELISGFTYYWCYRLWI